MLTPGPTPDTYTLTDRDCYIRVGGITVWISDRGDAVTVHLNHAGDGPEGDPIDTALAYHDEAN